MGKTFGVTALVFGIINIPFNLITAVLSIPNPLWVMDFTIISVIGWIITGIAIIFGILGAAFDDPKGSAVAGLVLGIFGLVVGFLLRSFFMNL